MSLAQWQTMATKILFLCTGNSCRSQMAEGWARHLKAAELVPYSAGIVAHGLNPLAVDVMREAGVDITSQVSQTVAELGEPDFDLVVTLCEHADAHCPRFPGTIRVVHVPFDDPPRLAEGARTSEEAKLHYRRVRDEIRDFISRWPEGLESA